MSGVNALVKKGGRAQMVDASSVSEADGVARTGEVVHHDASDGQRLDEGLEG